jgi:hypothetical protein
MTVATDPFTTWLEQAHVPAQRLTPQQQALLQAVFRFRQSQGSDYYSTRLLSHFLLHCQTGLKVAQIARLLGISRQTASGQQGLSSKQAIQQAHHRLDGRPYGKLLPRFAGPIAGFLLGQPDARRADLIDFIDRTFGVRVSRIAVYKFLKKYGLDRILNPAPAPSLASAVPDPAASSTAPASSAAVAASGALSAPAPPPSASASTDVPGVLLLPAPTLLLPSPASASAGVPLFYARTQYAGAFLLMGDALDWLNVAQGCFADEFGTLQRGLLSSVFALVIGLERIYHLDEMEDQGFAILTGGRRCPSRYSVGGWRRHLHWYEVDAFCRRTSPWYLIEGEDALLSFDEHTIPRWTHKFHIPKGYVTTRNKFMRCEKLFYTYDVVNNRYLAVRAMPGDSGLIDLAVPLTVQALQYGQPAHLHAIFDAGAGRSDAGVRALWDLAQQHQPHLDVTMRACRYPHRVALWKAVPAEQFEVYSEAGPYVGAPDKEIRLAETTTVLKGESPEQAVRTVICREIVPGPKKDRWHPLLTTSAVEPVDVLGNFRKRQHHEQAYRVGVHDEMLDAVPCGYDKDSPDPKRPGWQRGGLQMIGWLVALVFNAVAKMAVELAEDYSDSHVRTLRRTFLNRPGTLYQTPEALIVNLDPFSGQEALVPLIDEFNLQGHRLPWLENRRLVVCLTPQSQARSGP